MTSIASAPASSGNVGPGFDVLAIAFELRCHVTAQAGSAWSVTEEGRTYVPSHDSIVVQAASAVTSDPMVLRIDNTIPRARGLGSSAAVLTAVAAAVMMEAGIDPTAERLFAIVSGLEGHEDNAGAAVYGGCIAATEGRVRQLEVHDDLVFLAAIPEATLATRRARAVLSVDVERAVAARSLARIVFLVEGLRTASPDAFARAAGDELHELPRSALSPLTGTLMKAAYEAGALHAAWSGAGPAALAISSNDREMAVADAMSDVLAGAGTVMTLQLARRGWTVG